MSSKKRIEFIRNPGGSVVSKNILNGKGKLKWCIREKPLNDFDNGWRFLSDIDTDEFLSNPNNRQCVITMLLLRLSQQFLLFTTCL
jgi:hypothetical protein